MHRIEAVKLGLVTLTADRLIDPGDRLDVGSLLQMLLGVVVTGTTGQLGVLGVLLERLYLTVTHVALLTAILGRGCCRLGLGCRQHRDGHKGPQADHGCCQG